MVTILTLWVTILTLAVTILTLPPAHLPLEKAWGERVLSPHDLPYVIIHPVNALELLIGGLPPVANNPDLIGNDPDIMGNDPDILGNDPDAHR